MSDSTEPPTGMRYRGLDLDLFQSDAIQALDENLNVLVSAPTGTGKTVVADWMVEKVLSEGRTVIYTAPIKALSNQKFRDYCKLLGPENVGLVTGDLVVRPGAPCRVMTTEILRNMLLCAEDWRDLQGVDSLAAVVIDEIHFLDDRERGTTWEEVLIYLPHEVQIIGLSATLSNLDEFAQWLAFVRDREIVVVEETTRAVPLTFRIASKEGRLKQPKEMVQFHRRWQKKNAYALQRIHQKGHGSKHPHRGRHKGGKHGGGRRGRSGPPKLGAHTRHSDVFRMLYPDYAPYLYFVFSRRDAENLARSLCRTVQDRAWGDGVDHGLLQPDEQDEVLRRVQAFQEESTGANAMDSDLRRMLLNGIAFHHAGLHVMLKALVEELYESKLIKVLYCTSTFALGINMPARTAVFDGLMRFDGRQMIRLPAREFMQMAGRAGRRGMDDQGLVIIRTDIDDFDTLSPQISSYLSGRTEPVVSRFSLTFNSVINLLHRHPLERIQELVARSFLSFHRSNIAEKDLHTAQLIRNELSKEGWSEGTPIPKQLRKRVRRLHNVTGRAQDGTERTWREFQDKVEFLVHWGYLNEDLSFNAGAEVLLHIQIAEIFATELFLQGILDDLPPALLFGVLCGMCNSLPRAASTTAGKQHRSLGRHIESIRMSDMVFEAVQLTQSEVTWDPQMIPFGKWWAEGRTLSEILLNVKSATDISGDLVGAFRRAKDLASQLRGAWSEDPQRVEQVTQLIRSVSRDEVEVVA